MIWTKGLDNLKIFIDYLNNIHSTIKFTSSHSSTNIPFLDVNVSLTNDGNTSTDLYTKPTDKHQHLLHSSCHPLHKKKPFLSVLHSVYDVSVLPTLNFILALLNLPLTFLRANVSKGRESLDRTKKSNSILFYQKIPLGG